MRQPGRADLLADEQTDSPERLMGQRPVTQAASVGNSTDRQGNGCADKDGLYHRGSHRRVFSSEFHLADGQTGPVAEKREKSGRILFPDPPMVAEKPELIPAVAHRDNQKHLPAPMPLSTRSMAEL